MAKHIYIIDTCVLLHDPLALYKFKENDIYIPLAVIDDLDDIKTKRDNIGFAAREVFRQLENYTLQDLIKGAKIAIFLLEKSFKISFRICSSE